MGENLAIMLPGKTELTMYCHRGKMFYYHLAGPKVSTFSRDYHRACSHNHIRENSWMIWIAFLWYTINVKNLYRKITSFLEEYDATMKIARHANHFIYNLICIGFLRDISPSQYLGVIADDIYASNTCLTINHLYNLWYLIHVIWMNRETMIPWYVLSQHSEGFLTTVTRITFSVKREIYWLQSLHFSNFFYRYSGRQNY